ncbi:MAG: FAD-dependent oxidoreductase [Actinobacteria bacterium]|nr:FAD-dependent oxidoreductase [Actinomycetota bacterium]
MRVIVVGAGLAGLMAARELTEASHDVSVLDKGRSPGGRLATRRMAGARLDHGAQFFTVRSDGFRAHVDRWLADGVVHEWCRGFGEQDGHPRYVGTGGMNALAKHLATGLDVRCHRLRPHARPARRARLRQPLRAGTGRRAEPGRHVPVHRRQQGQGRERRARPHLPFLPRVQRRAVRQRSRCAACRVARRRLALAGRDADRGVSGEEVALCHPPPGLARALLDGPRDTAGPGRRRIRGAEGGGGSPQRSGGRPGRDQPHTGVTGQSSLLPLDFFS